MDFAVLSLAEVRIGLDAVARDAYATFGAFTAPAQAHPAASDIEADIIQRFVEQHRDAVARLQALDERRAARVIMTSPFVRVITYSVLDGWRLVFAHDRRHFEQARRVAELSEFPGS